MRKNVSGQKIGAQLITAADGTAFTGSVTVAVTVDAGTQATGSVGSGACAHEGGGYHTYAPAQAETNGDLVAFTFSGTGAIPVTVQVYTTPTDVTWNSLTVSEGVIFGSTGSNAGLRVVNSGSGNALEIQQTDVTKGLIIGHASEEEDVWFVNTAQNLRGYLDLMTMLLSPGTGTGQVKLSGGYVSPNWADIGSPTTTVNLSGTTVATTQKVDVETIKTQAVTCAAGVTVYPAVGMTATANTNFENVFVTDYATAFDTTIGAWNVANYWENSEGEFRTFPILFDSLTAENFATEVWGKQTSTISTAGSFAVAVKDILADTGTDGVVVATGSKTGYSLTATTGLGNQTANITGNLSGSVGSVTGAVGSVTGNVGGNVTGSVGSVVGAVGSVTGAVGSVTGNVGGNVVGSVASVTGGINTAAGTITTLDALDTAQDTQHGTTRTQLTSMSGATFDTATDSLEALRNRGDVSWTTATGFSTHSAADVVTALGTGSGLTALATQASVNALENLSQAQAQAACTAALLAAPPTDGAGVAIGSVAYGAQALVRNARSEDGLTLYVYAPNGDTMGTHTLTTDVTMGPVRIVGLGT